MTVLSVSDTEIRCHVEGLANYRQYKIQIIVDNLGEALHVESVGGAESSVFKLIQNTYMADLVPIIGMLQTADTSHT